MMSESEVAETVRREVIDLHNILQAWLGGESRIALEEILSHFQMDFVMISPAGRTIALDAFSHNLPGMYGSRPELKMEICDLKTVYLSTSTVMINYRERQNWRGNSNERISTALLVRGEGDPRLQWRFLQETWVA